jgi:hypothetical protein
MIVRRIVRPTLWAVKGVLALVALAALVAWPSSYKYPGEIGLSRQTIAREINEAHVAAAWSSGRLWVVHEQRWLTGKHFLRWARQAGSQSHGWRPDTTPQWRWGWDFKTQPRAWGPFEWNKLWWGGAGHSGECHAAALPLWLLAFTTGAWPLASAAQFIRRRRSRRLLPTNRCRQCGYDLRSTPDASGPPLPTCPECGHLPSAAPGTMPP